MPKYILTEGIIEKFMDSIFKSILKKRTEQMYKKMEQDPELIKKVKKVETAHTDLENHLKKNSKNYDEVSDIVDKIWN